MQFLASTMLYGAAAVSIPLALHFFYRARHTPLPWGPMKFLKEAIEQTSRRLKFQEIILLILRCLAIILLALAIARPASESASRSNRGDAVDAVFVIDNSFSMGARVGEKEKTRLDHAKESAIAVIATLPANSSVQVYSCSDRAKLVGPTQKLNMDQARHVIGTIQLTSMSSDLYPGLNEALAMAKAGTASAKEIYVFTDMQKEAVQRQEGAVRAKCEEIKAAANLVFIRCGDVSKRLLNVAVEDVTWHTESIPHTGPGVPFVVTLRNYGSEPVKSVKVSLEIDGKPVESTAREIEIVEADQTAPVTFTGSLEKPGVSVIAVRITEPEGLPGDNVFYKTILVRDKVRVLLVNGTPKPENPTGSGDHFIRTALNPAKIPNYYIESETVPANEVGPKDLDDKDIVYLLNAPIRDADPIAGMSADFLAALDKFVKNGGGLVIGCGDLVNGDLYDKTLGSTGTKLLPFDLSNTRSATETSPFHPAADTVEEASFLGRFRLSPYAQSLQGVSIFRMFGVTEAGASGRVLVRTTSGLPYITSKVVGAGEVILITGSLDESWGNFSSDPGSFQVPLAIFTVTHLTGRKVAGGSVVAGNPLVYYPPPEAGLAFELVHPDKQLPRTKLTAVEAGGKRTVTTPETDLAGIYRIVPAGKANESGPVFTVNPDIRESKSLVVASDDDLAGWLGFRPSIIQAGAGTDSAVTQLRTRSEWTEYALVLLLVLLVAETTWAWVCGRSW